MDKVATVGKVGVDVVKKIGSGTINVALSVPTKVGNTVYSLGKVGCAFTSAFFLYHHYEPHTPTNLRTPALPFLHVPIKDILSQPKGIVQQVIDAPKTAYDNYSVKYASYSQSSRHLQHLVVLCALGGLWASYGVGLSKERVSGGSNRPNRNGNL